MVGPDAIGGLTRERVSGSNLVFDERIPPVETDRIWQCYIVSITGYLQAKQITKLIQKAFLSARYFLTINN